ncbi:MAG: hypothetical protein JXR83_21055 [Deltaproteobacteria bacterium]|nr:hypothetical protein [Deltaproteobacteria bacterium]
MKNRLRLFALASVLALVSLGGLCQPKRIPVSSVELRSKLDKKLVALNVDLTDYKLGEVAQAIATGRAESATEIAVAMAEANSPYAQWQVYRSASDSLDEFATKLRRLSPAKCGLVDKPAETGICARAVVALNKVPTRGSADSELRVQGAAQGSARVEEILMLGPNGEIEPAPLNRDERAFDAVLVPRHGDGLYTVEVLARTGRGIEAAARWWLRVGSADLPAEVTPAPDPEGIKSEELIKRAFDNLNADRAARGAKPIRWSAALAATAGKRAAEYAAQGAVSPADPEMLAKLQIEGERALTNYAETLAEGASIAELQAEIMRSPFKRRTHLDPLQTTGAVAIATHASAPKRLFLVEVQGKSYNPNNAAELRGAIVDRVNVVRSRKGQAAVAVHPALQKYAQKMAELSLKNNAPIEKDDMGRTISDAILGDIQGLDTAGSETFKVSGAEEVTPGATPTDKRYTLIGVGVASKKSDAWWVVILVAAPEPARQPQ